MALSKVTYVDGVTIIGAKNLNDIQDELIRQGEQQTEDEESMETALALKADKETTYTKTEVDSALALKADKSDTYTKAQVDASLALKADKSDTYTKAEVDASLELKADKTETYTKAQVDGMVEDAIAEAVKESEYSNFEMKSVSGDFVHITDGAGLIPVKDLKIGIDAVQDLHGYDAPWVAGAGKNKFGCANGSYAVGSTRQIIVTDGVWQYKVNTSTSSSVFLTPDAVTAMNIPALKAGTYTFSLVSNISSDITSLVLNLSDGQAIANGSSFTISEDTSVVSMTSAEVIYPSGTYTCQIQIEAGSTATAWTPYENICPISGWTGAKVSVTGKNLMNVDAISAIHSTAQNIRNGVVFDEVGTYTVSANHEVSAGRIIYVRKYEKATDTYGSVTIIVSGSMLAYATYTISEGDRLIVFDASEAAISTTKELFKTAKVQVEFGSSRTDYEPFGTTYSITWQAEAGTVYGGTLDVTTGELAVTWKEIDMDSLAWSPVNLSETSRSQGLFVANNLTDIVDLDSYSVVADLISSQYSVYSAYKYISPNRDPAIGIAQYGKYIYVSDPQFINKTDAEVVTALDGVQLVYPLATPQTYQLTPTEVLTVLGENNIFADTGAIEELIYRISRQ